MGYDAIELIRSEPFDQWLHELRDSRAVALINKRLQRLRGGNVGDWKSVGDGVFELRVDTGPGYRIYFCRHGHRVVLLLCAGDKAGQRADIAFARGIRRSYPWQ
jgi:putative addiction module killer protein